MKDKLWRYIKRNRVRVSFILIFAFLLSFLGVFNYYSGINSTSATTEPAASQIQDTPVLGSFDSDPAKGYMEEFEILDAKRIVVERAMEAGRIELEAQKKAKEEAEIKALAEAERMAAEERKKMTAEEKRKAEEKWLAELNSKPLPERIKLYLGSKLGNVGLVYYDLTTGETIEVNGNKKFTAASTVKVPMNMVLFDKIVKGEIDINEALEYNSSLHYEGGTGILQGKDKSAPIPLKTLSDYSIIYSDNIATQMIKHRIGTENMKSTFEIILGHDVDRDKNTMTPSDAAAYLKLLYYNPGNNPYYPGLIDIMKKTAFHDRIDKYVPRDICAHKIGNYGSYVNDIGIIYAPKPYILAVFTEGMTAAANETISQVSKMIYEEQLKK